jgi:hypothetical protein
VRTPLAFAADADAQRWFVISLRHKYEDVLRRRRRAGQRAPSIRATEVVIR